MQLVRLIVYIFNYSLLIQKGKLGSPFLVGKYLDGISNHPWLLRYCRHKATLLPKQFGPDSIYHLQAKLILYCQKQHEHRSFACLNSISHPEYSIQVTGENFQTLFKKEVILLETPRWSDFMNKDIFLNDREVLSVEFYIIKESLYMVHTENKFPDEWVTPIDLYDTMIH